MDSIDTRQERERHIVRTATLNRGVQHLARRLELSAFERRHAVVQQLLRLALLFGHRASGAIDVRARARVIAIEKQRAGPDVDRLGVVSGKILIEARNEKALDFGVALCVAAGRGRRFAGWIRAERIGHARGQIMRQNQL